MGSSLIYKHILLSIIYTLLFWEANFALSDAHAKKEVKIIETEVSAPKEHYDDVFRSMTNCSDYIQENCTWNAKGKTLLLSNDNPCIFSCKYNPKEDHPGPIRLGVYIRSNILHSSNVFVSVQQNHYLSSWTLPILFPEHGEKQPFTSLEEMLCPPRAEDLETLFFSLTSHSMNLENISFNISLTRTPYKLKLNENVTIKSTPVSPWFKFYEWQDGQEAVLVNAVSVGKNDRKVCALLSLQNAMCPVEADQKGITASRHGRYQSFQDKGGMVAKRTMFPDGIHIVVLPLADDSLCTGIVEDFENKTSRSKSTLLSISEHATISQVWGKFVGMAIILIVTIIGSTVAINMMIRRNLNPGQFYPSEFESDDNQLLVEGDNGMTTSGSRMRTTFATGGVLLEGSQSNGMNSSSDSQHYAGNYNQGTEGQANNAGDRPLLSGSANQRQGVRERLLAITGGNIDSEDPHCQMVVAGHGNLADNDVFHFTRQNNPRCVYWWKMWAEHVNESPEAQVSEIGFQRNMIIVAVFMALPFSEILRSYMHVFAYHGSEDQCYYNTRCITSYGIFPDFSRVFTNIGYLLGGFCFWFTLKAHKKLNSKISAFETLGVSRNYALFTSLAFGLIIQFFMSALYHICPNRVTLRFDMIFMYVDVIVLVVGVWGFRHGSVAPHVYPTVGLVGVALLAAELRDWVAPWLFWTTIAFIQIVLTVTTSVMLFRFGTWSFSPMSMVGIWKDWQPIARSLNDVFQEESSIKPWTLLRTFIGIALNIALIFVGCFQDMEVYMYILLICVANMVLYLGNYVFTKVLHGEKGTLVSWICFGVSSIFLVTAFIFYSMHFTNSEATAAVSRALNSECVLMGVFDAHDIWHIASSLAMFFAFMGIITLDDDLASHNPRKIPVF